MAYAHDVGSSLMASWGNDRRAHEAAADLAKTWALDDVRLDEDQPSHGTDGMWLRWLYDDGDVAGTTIPYNFAFAAPNVAEHCFGVDNRDLHACVLTHRSVTIARNRKVDPHYPELATVRSIGTVVVTAKTAAVVEVEYDHHADGASASPRVKYRDRPLDVDAIARSPYCAVVLAMTTSFPDEVHHAARERLGV